MTDFEFQPRDAHRLRHAPGWVGAAVVAAILLAEFAVLWWASGELAARPMRHDPGTLRALIVGTLFVGAGLQFVVLAMPPLVEISGRHILRRRWLGLDDPETMPLGAVEEIRQQGWRMTVTGGGRRLSFPCPPRFAPRIRRAIERGREAARRR